MAILSDSTDIGGGPTLTEADLAAARHDVPGRLGAMPFPPGAANRSLWVVFLSPASVWTYAVLPVDDRLDKPEPEHITRLSQIVAMALCFPLPPPGKEALVVLRRPAPAAITEADAYIFRLVCAAASARRAAPWRFYVTGPDGARECFRQTQARRPSSSGPAP